MSWSKPLRLVLTLHCREASALASRELDEPLSRSERIALQGHRLVCASCRRFGRQLRYLHEILPKRAAGRPPAQAEEDGLSDGARQRIRDVLARALDEPPDRPS